MPLLLHDREIEGNELPLEEWKKDAYQLFTSKMTDREARFPCIPATQAFSMGHLRYGFVSTPLHESTARELTEIITEYGEHSRSFGDYSSLVIFFEPEETHKEILEYELIFWNLLSQISDLDNRAWPEDIPKDPEQAQWEFCYNDERYFVYCSTPAHRSRKSRNFAYFMLALTPRWVLNQWNANPQKAAATAPRIRTRLAAYDSVPAHPELKSYGSEGNLEYKQYFLRDDDTSPSKCPFHSAMQKEKVKE